MSQMSGRLPFQWQDAAQWRAWATAPWSPAPVRWRWSVWHAASVTVLLLWGALRLGPLAWLAHPLPEPMQMRAAAEQAIVDQFVLQWPETYDTRIGERGITLSGGQRQRLAIARAIYKNAPILILDEATSALDSESERQVQDALDRLMAGRTTLVIAHRLSTIEHADRIVVLEHGQIVENGSHADLIEKDGLYANLHRIQFSNA